MISGNVPQHLVLGARAGFLNALKASDTTLWRRVAATVDMDGKSLDLVDLGSTPMPTEAKGGLQVQEFVERAATIRPRNWEVTVNVSYNALKDGRIGDLDRRVRDAGSNFNRHMNKLVFQALNGGDTATYGLTFDGMYLFSNTHTYPSATYTTAQDNLLSLDLTLENFNTAWTTLATFNDDQGEPMGFDPSLLVVAPALRMAAAQITDDKENPDTGDRQINPYAGEISYVTTPYLDSTAWILVCANENIKPLILAMREQPSLQSAWFDPAGPDGGLYFFKFYSRYTVVYGNPLLAILGHS